MASGLSPQLTAQISFSARVIILGLWGSLSKRCDLGFVLRSHGRGRVLSQAGVLASSLGRQALQDPLYRGETEAQGGATSRDTGRHLDGGLEAQVSIGARSVCWARPSAEGAPKTPPGPGTGGWGGDRLQQQPLHRGAL